MRLRHADGSTVHLGYCTNVHPAEDAAGILAQLDTHAEPVREALGADLLGPGGSARRAAGAGRPGRRPARRRPARPATGRA
ncbi:xylose isomerase, partial [Micromonospora purpureochromogenes]